MFKFRITPDGKEPYEVEAQHRDILRWERTKNGTVQQLREPTMTALFEIAWIASRRTGQFTGSAEAFEEICELDTVDEPEETPDPTRSAASAEI